MHRSARSERPCQRGTEQGTPEPASPGVQLQTVDPANELSQFLTSRRAKVTPEQAGLPSYGQRRVPGLRREEVASLAGVSVEYYKRLERGNATGASDAVLDALADALRLDDAERAHLSTSPAPPARSAHGADAARPSSASGRSCSASSTASTRPRP